MQRSPRDMDAIASSFSFATFRRVLLLLMGLGALLFLVQVARYVPSSTDNMYAESSGVYSALRWAHGSALYTDPQEPPYLLSSFPPLWYVCMALAAKAGFSDLDALTRFGRFFTVFFLLATTGLVYFWNRRRGFAPEIAALSPLFYLCFPILMPWAVAARQDFPSFFFSLLSLMLIAASPGIPGGVLAAISAAIAFLFKHSSAAAPTAIVLWLLWRREWKHAAVFCICWGLVVGTVLESFQITSGGLMKESVFAYRGGSISFRYLHEALVHIFGTGASGFAIALLAFAAYGLLQKESVSEGPSSLVALYFVATLGYTSLVSMVANAADNHWLEAALAWSLLVPAGLDRMGSAWEREPDFARFSFVLLLLLLLPGLDLRRWIAVNEKPASLHEVVPLVLRKRVLTDMPYLGARSLAPEFLDSMALTFTEQSGEWSSKGLIEEVHRRKYDLVVLHRSLENPRWQTTRFPRFDKALRTAIAQNYRLCFDINSAHIYAPLVGDGRGFLAPRCPAPPPKSGREAQR